MVLNLVQVVAERTDALRLLEEAYEAGIGIDGDRPIVLDSMLEAARAKGFYGSLELAAGVLRVSGRFRLEKGPMDKWRACPAIDRSCPGGHEAETDRPGPDGG